MTKAQLETKHSREFLMKFSFCSRRVSSYETEEGCIFTNYSQWFLSNFSSFSIIELNSTLKCTQNLYISVVFLEFSSSFLAIIVQGICTVKKLTCEKLLIYELVRLMYMYYIYNETSNENVPNVLCWKDFILF